MPVVEILFARRTSFGRISCAESRSAGETKTLSASGTKDIAVHASLFLLSNFFESLNYGPWPSGNYLNANCNRNAIRGCVNCVQRKMHPRGGLASASRTSASGGCKKSGREEKLVVRRSAIDERRPERGEGGCGGPGSRAARGRGGKKRGWRLRRRRRAARKTRGFPRDLCEIPARCRA